MMNKKQIVGFCGLILMMCFGLLLALGCKEDKEVEPAIEEIVVVEETQNEIVEEEIDIQEPEEAVVEEIVEPEVVEEEIEINTFDEDELHYYLTTNLTDSEYEAYFNEAMWGDNWTLRPIEFDAHILEQTKSEKYKTRCELLLASGDYDNGNFTGPYIKTRDIAYTELEGAHEGSNVRVTAVIEEYDVEHGWLKITIRDISVR